MPSRYLYNVFIDQLNTINPTIEDNVYSNFEINSNDLLSRIFMFRPNGKYSVKIVNAETNETLCCKVFVLNKSVSKVED